MGGEELYNKGPYPRLIYTASIEYLSASIMQGGRLKCALVTDDYTPKSGQVFFDADDNTTTFAGSPQWKGSLSSSWVKNDMYIPDAILTASWNQVPWHSHKPLGYQRPICATSGSSTVFVGTTPDPAVTISCLVLYLEQSDEGLPRDDYLVAFYRKDHLDQDIDIVPDGDDITINWDWNRGIFGYQWSQW